MVLSAAKQPGTATDKKSAVESGIEAVTPVLGELLMAKMGHTVTDTARFQAGVDACIEGILDIYKSFGAVPVNAKVAISPAVEPPA